MIKNETRSNIKNLIIVITMFILIVICDTISKQQKTINELTECVDELVKIEKEQTNQIQELWKNIDALSEDYCTLWTQLYGEDSWHDKGGN